MDKTFWRKVFLSHQECPSCPSPAEVVAVFSNLLGTLFPDFKQLAFDSEQEFNQHITSLKADLVNLLKFGLSKNEADTTHLANQFFDALPAIYEKIAQDVVA